MLTKVIHSLILLCGVAMLPCAHLNGQEKIKAEVVFLRDGGFFPNTIQRRPGKFLLIVKHRSSASEISLGIVRSDKKVMIANSKELASSRDFVLELGVGDYTVADSNHPDWTPLTITVTP